MRNSPIFCPDWWRKSLSVATVACAAFVSSVAQTTQPAQTFSVQPQWREGETFHYHVIKTQSKDDGKATTGAKSEYIATIRVISLAKPGPTFEYSFDHFKMLEPKDAADAALSTSALVSAASKIAVRYRTDSSYRPVAVDNWEDVISAVGKADDEANKGFPPAEQKKRHDSFMAFLNAPAYRTAVETSMLNEPVMFHAFFGRTFREKPVAADENVSNPFGGDPIPSTTILTFEKAEAGATKVHLHLEGGPKTGDLIAHSLQKADQSAGRKSDVPDHIQAKLVIAIDGVFEPGRPLPKSIHYEKRVQVEDISQSATFDIEAVDPPATQKN